MLVSKLNTMLASLVSPWVTMWGLWQQGHAATVKPGNWQYSSGFFYPAKSSAHPRGTSSEEGVPCQQFLSKNCCPMEQVACWLLPWELQHGPFQEKDQPPSCLLFLVINFWFSTLFLVVILILATLNLVEVVSRPWTPWRGCLGFSFSPISFF